MDPGGDAEAERCLLKANDAQQSGNLEAAYRFYTTGLKTARDPELRATMLGNRSVLWARMGHWGKALEDAEEGVQLRPEWSRSHECKGAALEGLGRLEDALASFSKALALDADNTALQEIVADLQNPKGGSAAKKEPEAVQVARAQPRAVQRAAAPPPPPKAPAQEATSHPPAQASQGQCRVLLTVMSAQHLPSMDLFGSCDGLVEIDWDGQKVKTTAKKNTYSPEWNEEFTFAFPSEKVGDLVLAVKDWDQTAVVSYDHVGEAVIKGERLSSFLREAQSPAQSIQIFRDIEVKDKKGKQVIGADKQPCVISVKVQRTDLPAPAAPATPLKGREKMEGKSPVPAGHEYANPSRRVFEEQRVQYEPADLAKINFTSDLSTELQVKSPPGSKSVHVQPSSEPAHVMPGIHDRVDKPLQPYDQRRFGAWEEIKNEGSISPRDRDYYQGDTPIMYLGISYIRDESATVRVPKQPSPPPSPKPAPPPPPPPESPKVVAEPPPEPPKILMGDSTVMQDHPVLYETTTYAVEQKAVHSSSSYYSTSASSSYYSTSAYPLPARRDSPEYLRISNQSPSRSPDRGYYHQHSSSRSPDRGYYHQQSTSQSPDRGYYDQQTHAGASKYGESQNVTYTSSYYEDQRHGMHGSDTSVVGSGREQFGREHPVKTRVWAQTSNPQ
eukprot:Tamp_08406.p1 GENE.Tamp_08406~~Tamp_08406.p1  ORF type:complete len:694 (+),score=111.52 Tamp_08406:75-2084(+)